VLLDLGRVVSFAFSILSLYALLGTAFFVPGSRWEDRLIASLARIVLAGCVCIASGILFRFETHPAVPLSRTLPVRMFVWALFGVAILFVVSWYIDVYYMPFFWRNLPH
jgi:hypothetical protein